MAALDFPSSPSIGDSVLSPEGRRWVWNGSTWASAFGAIDIGATGPTGPVGPTSYASLSTVSGITFTPSVGDENKLLYFTSSSAVTLTVPTNTSAPFTIGNVIDLVQYGAGQITIQGDTGVTLRCTVLPKTRTQYSFASIIKVGTNEWILTGDLAVT